MCSIAVVSGVRLCGVLLPILVCRFPVAGCCFLVSAFFSCLQASCFSVLGCFSCFGLAASRRKPAGWLPFRGAGCSFTAAGVLLPIVFPFCIVFLVSGVPCSPQVRWMAPVSRCRVPVYGRRAPASNLSVPVSRCPVILFLCRAPFLAFRLLFFLSWRVFLVSGVPRIAAGPLDGSRFALQGARLRLQGSCFQS